MPLALGTDTAGSGRVPAGLNNIVGLKPSLGDSTAGVVPACRSLDCVSVFALTTDDAWTAFAVIAGRTRPIPIRASGRWSPRRIRQGTRVGVPIASQREFFGDRASAAPTIGRSRALRRSARDRRHRHRAVLRGRTPALRGPLGGGTLHRAESLLASSPESIHPVTREIIWRARGRARSIRFPHSTGWRSCAGARRDIPGDRRAAAADRAHRLYGEAGAGRPDPAQQPARHLYQLRQSARPLRPCGAGIDARRRHSVRRDAACARRARRTAGLDRTRLSRRHRIADGRAEAAAAAARDRFRRCRGGEIAIAVVGAHLSGMPLNGELKAWARGCSKKPPPRPTIGSMRCGERARRSPGCFASRRAGQRHRARNLGAHGRGLRAVCCRHPLADVDRHVAAPTAARSKAFWSRRMRWRMRRIFPASAVAQLLAKAKAAAN